MIARVIVYIPQSNDVPKIQCSLCRPSRSNTRAPATLHNKHNLLSLANGQSLITNTLPSTTRMENAFFAFHQKKRVHTSFIP